MSARGLPNDTRAAAYQLLQLTAASADAAGPLKSVASGALYITDIVKVQPSCPVLYARWADFTLKSFRTRKAEWKNFSDYMQKVVGSVIGGLARSTASRQDLERMLNDLKREVSTSLQLDFA